MTLSQNRKTYTLSAKQREALISRYRAGEDSNALAKAFGVHPDYVRVAGRRAGVIRRPYRVKAVA